jgi:hypothetical protein
MWNKDLIQMQQYYEIWVMYESRSITEGNKEDEYV